MVSEQNGAWDKAIEVAASLALGGTSIVTSVSCASAGNGAASGSILPRSSAPAFSAAGTCPPSRRPKDHYAPPGTSPGRSGRSGAVRGEVSGPADVRAADPYGRRVVDDFSARFGDLLTGSCDCVDRIVLNARWGITRAGSTVSRVVPGGRRVC